MENTENKSNRRYILYAFIVAATGIEILLCLLFSGGGQERLVVCEATAVFGSLILAFVYEIQNRKGLLSYNNSSSAAGFFTAYLFCLAVSFVMQLLDPLVWPYMIIYVLLSLFSSASTGFFAGSLLLFLNCLMAGEGGGQLFFVYMVSGCTAIYIFSDLDKEFKVVTSAVCCVFVQAFSFMLFHFVSVHGEVKFELFVLPIINTFISGFCLLLIYSWFSSSVLNLDTQRYMEINDPEFPLMAAIRSKNEAEYYKSLHVAYLSEKAAECIGIECPPVKSLAYYKGIGCLDEKKNSWDDIKHYYKDFDFPKKSRELLYEYEMDKGKSPRSKEATIVRLCEELVLSLTDIFSKNKDAQVNYSDVIDRILNSKLENYDFNESSITLKEYDKLSAALKKEKLYYDFLR